MFILTIKDLSKSFGQLKVLDHVSLNVKKGEVIAILGPSGTGKSTLLRCINYLEKPEKGQIRVGDFHADFSQISREEIYKLRRHSAMVFQQYNLFKNKTVIENVMEALITVQKKDEKEARAIAERELGLVGMLDKINEYPSRLSGGQEQRVGIARAIAVQPEILLLDEPTSALDPELVDEVLQTIRKLADLHMTMLIVTHELHFARQVADRIILLSDGKIVEEGEPETILKNPKHQRTKQFLATFANQEKIL